MTTIIAEKEQEPALQDPRPFLKWAGGKNGLLRQYQPYFPKEFRTYFEPFLGGGAVFFHLLPEKAFLSDINFELVNAYQVVVFDLDKLISLLTEHQSNHSPEYYYQIRGCNPGDLIEKAARFIYLNKTCFNGTHRVNKKGEFNTPIGRDRNGHSQYVCDVDGLKSASLALRKSAYLDTSDFTLVGSTAEKGDFVYFDPPYHPVSETAKFTSYSANGFDKCDQIALAAVFKSLAERKVKVMLSNSDCPLIWELYKGFEIVSINATRSINSDGQKRGKVGEILVVANCN